MKHIRIALMLSLTLCVFGSINAFASDVESIEVDQGYTEGDGISIFTIDEEETYTYDGLSQEVIDKIEFEKWQEHNTRSNRKLDFGFAFTASLVIAGSLFILRILNVDIFDVFLRW